MTLRPADLEAELIDAVCARVHERLPQETATPCAAFVRQYYHWVPAGDLAARRPLDLYGAAVAHWNLAQQRLPGRTKVHVYNPDVEQHGWQSPHTVIDVVSDDMRFLIDSVTMELSRQGYAIELMIHPVTWVRRDEHGLLLHVLESGVAADGAIPERILHAELVREASAERLRRLRCGIEGVIEEVRRAVKDWEPMRQRVASLIDEFENEPPPINAAELDEDRAFLAWVADSNFIFLGYREYDLALEDGEGALTAVPGSGLGIFRGMPARPPTRLRPRELEIARGRHPLVLTKADSRATVRRPAYLDYIGVKRFGPDGQVVGERRFLGLYTTAAYKGSVREIPSLRLKLASVLDRAGFPSDSHEAGALIEIVESYPRDSLFEVTVDDLFDLAMGVLGLGERQRVRLFVCRDRLDRFVECLVTIPRDRYNAENRKRVGAILLEAFGGTLMDWTTHLSASVLARVYYRVRCADGVPVGYEVREIEARLVEATRTWSDDLRDALTDALGEEQAARMHERYEDAFPPGYRSEWLARAAVADLLRLEELGARQEPILSLYRPQDAQEGLVRCKLFSSASVLLSDVLPTFEHMGAKVVDERPYEITPRDGTPAWIYDFGLQATAEDVDRVRDRFEDAFLGVWRGDLEDDHLNGLLLSGLTGREIAVIRAIGRYLRQAAIPFSDAYMVRALLAHPDIATMLLQLFGARFDPDRHDEQVADEIAAETERAIDAVDSLDEDRILRSFLHVIGAILRTNFFQRGPRPYLSFKLDPSRVPLLPVPRPRFEIFVYSPRVEGVHLRGGMVARGGVRWSDRLEDFRTEILGLMKAQTVKNALIVPVGSKGGFVVKRPPTEAGTEAVLEETIACYRMFLCGLLDLTDNIVDRDVVAPDRVVRRDEDDPYLVVAADKGTASFSDIANEVSAQYGFWLGDAFASGGSQGYDHKAMGITARGAWESVQRHFRELGTDIHTTDFTAVGVGDMSGDVFGNGMLLSRHIKLIAAFNHIHIFLDPDPDPNKSFEERKRLFEMHRSAWSDYDESLISDGGGVYRRTAKSIPISDRVKEVLRIQADKLAPNDLIRELLKAPVDLLWNGGIGTYVKAASETNEDAGDKANDAVRVDGRELRCRVVGEGGNLGVTQRGRIEYALHGGPECRGGRINTDAIDNVAGVSCSDYEVNIKILLDSLVAAGDMTGKARNDLLVQMTDEVADRVRYASYTQTQALSLALTQAERMVEVHTRLLRHLEKVAGLNREIEFLPSDEVINDRKLNHQGLVAPELAVLMAYCKIHLYSGLLASDLPEDDYLEHDLEQYFPLPLPERFAEHLRTHRLRREIIATVVANQVVDRAGTTFGFRLTEETGASASLLARAFATAREVFGMRSFWSDVERLDNQIETETQLKMLIEGRRLVEGGTRWLLTAYPERIDIALTVRRFEEGAKTLTAALPEILDRADHAAYVRSATELRAAGVPPALAANVAGMPSMSSVFDIVEAAHASARAKREVMAIYFRLGSRLQLNWLRDRILDLPRTNVWQALAGEALRDDLYTVHRSITQDVLETAVPASGCDDAIAIWEQRNQETLERCLEILENVRACRTYDATTLPVALRAVRKLIKGPLLHRRPTAPVT